MIENVIAWWTGQSPLKGDELERTRQAMKEAAESFWEPGDPPFDSSEMYYASTGVVGAKYWLPRKLKRLFAHQLFCAIAGAVAGACLAKFL